MLLTILMFIAFLIEPYWWWILVLPFFYGVLSGKKLWQKTLTGLLSTVIVWFGATIYFYFMNAENVAETVAAMMNIDNPYYLLAISAAMAVICGAVGAFAGHSLRALFKS